MEIGLTLKKADGGLLNDDGKRRLPEEVDDDSIEK